MGQRKWAVSAIAALGAACVLVGGCSTSAEKKADDSAPLPLGLAYDAVEAKSRLELSSPDLPEGKPIPEEFTKYGANKTPKLLINSIPETAVSFVIVLEDPDAPGKEPFVHWVVYNIPLKDAALNPVPPATAPMGKNSAGSADYFGPKPPQGDSPHHYHFQVFALNKELDIKPGAPRDEVVNAFSRNVLAKGDYVVLYGKP